MDKQDSGFDRLPYIKRLKECHLFFFAELGRRLERGDKPTSSIDVCNLKVLLEEFNLGEYLNDFLILTSIINEDYPEANGLLKQVIQNRIFDKELLDVLIFLFKNNDEKIIINLKHISIKSKVSIQNKYLIKHIRKALLKLYFDNNEDIRISSIKEDDIEYWRNYFENIKSHSDELKVYRGRPYKNELIGFCVQEIFIFLHNFTQLKAPKGTLISRKQASFIYKYLDMIGYIPVELAWGEDNIRHILREYMKRDYLNPSNPEDWVKEWDLS